MTVPFSYKGLEIGLDYANPLRLGFNPTSKSRTTRDSIENVLSDEHVLNYSLPQGSVDQYNNICFHSICYAGDIQLYAAFDYMIPGDCEQAMERIILCISDINRWMLRNKLQLNQDKTEFFCCC